MIQELSKEEVQRLSVNDLALRMDEVLTSNHFERYPHLKDIAHCHMPFRPSVIDFVNTAHVKNMEDRKQKAVAYLLFNTLLQMEYSNASSAALNYLVHSQENPWSSARCQVNNAAFTQFGIISSRISMECFMELVHYLGEGERIKSKRSTFKSFKKWLNDSKNPFSYFATHILRAFLFDRAHRTPEVHGASKLSNTVLRMSQQTSEDSQDRLQLTNVMLNVWHPLFEILESGKNSMMHGSETDFEWLRSYLHDDDHERSKFLEGIFDQMQ